MEVTLSTGTIRIVMFEDDMVMMAEMKKVLQHNVEAMNKTLIRWDLREEVKGEGSRNKERGVSGSDWR